MKSILLLLAGWLAFTTHAAAQAATQSDFARGAVLDTTEGAFVQRLTMPDDSTWAVRMPASIDSKCVVTPSSSIVLTPI